MSKSLALLAAIFVALGVSQGIAATQESSGTWENWLARHDMSAELNIRWFEGHRRVRSVHGVLVSADDARSPEKRVTELVGQILQLEGMTQGELADRELRGTQNRVAFRYSQQYQGLPVEGHELVVVTRKDGAVVALENNLMPFVKPATPVVISSNEARARAMAAMPNIQSPQGGELSPSLVVLAFARVPVRAWRVPVAALPNGLYSVYVRADNGAILWIRNELVR